MRFSMGPGHYLITPALWLGLAVVWRSKRAQQERMIRNTVKHVFARLQVSPQEEPGVLALARRLTVTSAFCVAGAAAGTTALYSALDMPAIYTRHLEAIEDILLFGGDTRDPRKKVHGPGLLQLAGALDAWNSTLEPSLDALLENNASR